MTRQPNVLFVMTDQQRFDTIAALGNGLIHTPNMDRLVARGIAVTEAYSTTPVCIPARYTIRSGCEAPTTGVWANMAFDGMHAAIERRCGPYLAARMHSLGYRTWGVGKFHTIGWDADVGFEVQLHSEEFYADAAQRAGDAYAQFIATEHPGYDWIESLMGERTEMYYIPQMSPLPAALTVEAWAADRAVELIGAGDERPWFGLVSFVGPHPPFAPPLPYSRMYDPDRMPNPVRGDREVDHLDDQLPWMNYAVWAEDISDSLARILKARYYGEISYIDHCLGRILDAVRRQPDADDTLICFFADHGELLGDHWSWQKESYFEASTKVPFLVSWPSRLPGGGEQRAELVSLADLFGIATTGAGEPELREGVDLLGIVRGEAQGRETLFGFYGVAGTPAFKMMVRRGPWKYIYLSNGGREQLFDVVDDPNELRQRVDDEPQVAAGLRALAVAELRRRNCAAALDGEGEDLRAFEFCESRRVRIYQFDRSRGVTGFPVHPRDALT